MTAPSDAARYPNDAGSSARAAQTRPGKPQTRQKGHHDKRGGGRIAHLDVTLICERPKVGPYRDAMRARIAEITGLDLSRVAVKATTSERLGFTGREEGIAATASATIRLPWDDRGWSDNDRDGKGGSK